MIPLSVTNFNRVYCRPRVSCCCQGLNLKGGNALHDGSITCSVIKLVFMFNAFMKYVNAFRIFTSHLKQISTFLGGLAGYEINE